MATGNDRVVVWAGRINCQPHTLKEYQSICWKYLHALRTVDPTFSALSILRNGVGERLPSDRTAFDQLIKEAVYDAEHPERYDNLANGDLSYDSTCRIGFFTSYFCYPNAASAGDDGVELELQGASAGSEPNLQVSLLLPSARKHPLNSPSTVRCLLEIALKFWDGRRGGAAPMKYRQTVQGQNSASYAGHWLFYLPQDQFGTCLQHKIDWERFHNGMLVQTTAHIPDAVVRSDIAAGERIREGLDEFGLMVDSTYAIEGWPPDPEEWRYEEFITGAPPGRKYTVHCIDFDGFDAQRKVLLYAKLFRRLRRHPKHWGLRGWDGPVLNEAKRQIRAAAKAGGVPIEWHVGIEESAERVRELLDDHTDITEAQLKVIYTPLEQMPKT